MSEHPGREDAADEQQQGQDESPQGDSPAGASDPAPAELDIPLPEEESDIAEEA